MKKTKKAVFFALIMFMGATLAGCNLFVKPDVTPPVILGMTNYTLEVHSDEPNWMSGISATDDKDGNITSKVEVDIGELDLTTLGTYDVVYRVEDAAGNKTHETITVSVVDTTAPVILNTQDMLVEVYSQSVNYIQNITVTDNYHGDLLGSLVVDDSQVNLNVLGVYPLTYSVEDSSGNQASVTVDVSVVDTTAPVILGAVDLIVEGGSSPNWLAGITAEDAHEGDLTSQILIDDSEVNLNIFGVYSLTYTVADSSQNEASVTIEVEVVAYLVSAFVNLENLLLTELLGRELTAQEQALIEEVAVLRAQNYGIAYMPDMELTISGVQEIFIIELTTQQAEAIIDYANMWISALDEPASGLTQYDGQRIMISFIIGREFTVAEANMIPIMEALESDYEALKDYENSRFDDAEIAEIEFVLGRSLTASEIDSIELYSGLRSEMMSKMMMLMTSKQIGRMLTLEEMNAIKTIIDILMELQVEGMLPSIEDAESYLRITFTAEQEEAYLVIANIYDEIMFNMILETVESQWGREATVEEIEHLRIYIDLMFEYMVSYTENVDPDFNNASVHRIEAVIDRSLTLQELESHQFFSVVYIINMVEYSIGRELTQTEKDAVPVVLNVQYEYYDSMSEFDPEFESATNNAIETVIARLLTTDEEDALVLFRAIISQMAQ